jgi:chloride channel 3/4/5
MAREVEVTCSADDIQFVRYFGEESTLQSNYGSKTYSPNTYIDWTRECSTANDGTPMVVWRKWIVVFMSSIFVGYIVYVVDLVAVMLNDFKKGVCLGELDKWSLLNPYQTCPSSDWNSWSMLFFNSNGWISGILINFPIYLVFAMIFALVAAKITQRSPLIKNSGIPEIKLILAGLNYDVAHYLSLNTLVHKLGGLVLVVSSGLWLGKEGPFVHVACCIFNILYQMVFSELNEALRREFLSAATATGIAVAFNAPIGGVLFVVESMPSFLIPTKIMWNSFVTATLAVVTVSGLSVFTAGKDFMEQDLFSVEFGNFSWLFLEFIPFMILGCLGGIYGAIFTKLHATFSDKSLKARIQTTLCKMLNLPDIYGPYLEIATLLLVTALLNFPLGMSKLPLSSFLKALFTACPTEKSTNSINFICLTSEFVTATKLLYITIEGFVLAAYSFGVDLPGGILMPSLVLGATSGRFLGIICKALQHSIGWDATCTEGTCLVSPSSYAVIGAASYMSGVTKLTMSVVVIIFELSGAVSYVVPIMLSVMILKFTNDFLCKWNIYDSWLSRNFNRSFFHKGYPNEGKGHGLVNFTNLQTRIKAKLPEVSVNAVMVPLEKTKCICIVPQENYTRTSIIEFCNNDTHEGYPVIASYENPISLGYVHKPDLLQLVESVENDTIIRLQAENLPSEVISLQLRYEQSVTQSLIPLQLPIDRTVFVVNELVSMIVVLETFEKLNLNYLILMDSSNLETNNIMKGFIDKFILSNLIDKDFSSLKDELSTGPDPNSNDIEAFASSTVEESTLLSSLPTRPSVDLIT